MEVNLEIKMMRGAGTTTLTHDTPFSFLWHWGETQDPPLGCSTQRKKKNMVTLEAQQTQVTLKAQQTRVVARGQNGQRRNPNGDTCSGPAMRSLSTTTSRTLKSSAGSQSSLRPATSAWRTASRFTCSTKSCLGRRSQPASWASRSMSPLLQPWWDSCCWSWIWSGSCGGSAAPSPAHAACGVSPRHDDGVGGFRGFVAPRPSAKLQSLPGHTLTCSVPTSLK
mmetsp:Transcript_40437/g.94635  ORF Transcript_40437/g.94635 Transcript_40437/m.94635 type:complete len:223 (+) Transcript_40437:410-1078(+)